MAYDQYIGEHAHAQHDESVFPAGVILVVKLDRMIVEEHGLGFGKRNSVFLLVRSILPWIPLELDHACNVCTKYATVKPAGRARAGTYDAHPASIFTPIPISNSANSCRNLAAGNRCARRAPRPAVRLLAMTMPNQAGQ